MNTLPVSRMLRIETPWAHPVNIEPDFARTLALLARTSADALRLCVPENRIDVTEPYTDWRFLELGIGERMGGWACMEQVSDAGMHWHRTSTREDASVSPPRGAGTLLAAAAIALFATSDARTCSWTSLHEAMGFHLGCLGLFAPTLEMLGIRTAVDGYDFLLEK